MPNLSKQRANKLLSLTPEWMAGKISLYEVAKRAGVRWHTAKKWMPIYAEMINKNQAVILAKLTQTDTSQENLTTWQKIKKSLISSLMIKA